MDWPIERSWLLRTSTDTQESVATPKLAEYQAVCLLGAAGLGKTWEIKRLANHEEKLGRGVSQVQLGRAATSAENLRKRLDNAVDRAGEQGAIFLDALDEAMIPMRQAAAVVDEWIQQRLQHKPCLRIACRSAVWPGILSSRLASLYGDSSIVSVELRPFTQDDIRAIAECEEIDADAFLDAVRSARVLVLAQHPLTLKLLISEFRSGGGLSSSRYGLFDKCVLRLCTERVERRERGTAPQIAPHVLVAAAERLSVYSVTSGREVIDLGDGDNADTQTLHWLELARLPCSGDRPLDTDLLRALAGTGLFIQEDDRRFRFLHRQFAEFLAGRRIAPLPVHQARALLSSDAGWSQGVAGPLWETSAVAASFNLELAKWIAEVEPEVIGRSDVADKRLRRTATLALLNLFRRHKLTDSQLFRDKISLNGLRYDDAEADLRRVLNERDKGLEDVQACAIELASSWGLTALSDDLADLLLDDDVSRETRKDAGYALLQIGTDDAKHRTRPLITGANDDENEDLKGLALRCNWPDNLTTGELLEVLTPPRRQSYGGAYSGFLFDLDRRGFDAADDRIAGLRWASSVLESGGFRPSVQRIASRIALAAIDDLDQPEICEHFVNYVVAAAKIHASPFRESGDEDTESRVNQCRDRLTQDPSKRRLLLDMLALRDEERYIAWEAAKNVPGLLQAADFQWLLSRSIDESRSMEQRERYAQLAAWLPWREDAQMIDAWLAVREKEPVQSVLRMPLYVELGSKEAEKLREVYELSRDGDRDHQPKPLDPPPIERIRTCLDRSVDDPRWFAQLVRDLTLTETSTLYEFERFVTNTPGWKAVTIETKDEILDLAKRLLQLLDDLPAKCRRVSLNTILGNGGMPAMFLLLEKECEWLEQRDVKWWERWAWYILRELHLGLSEEPDEPKHKLLLMLHERVRNVVRAELVRLARRKDGGHLLTSLLRAIKEASDVQLDDAFCELVGGKVITGESLSSVMTFVLQRCPEKGVPVCVGRLSVNSQNRPSVPAVRAAVALLQERAEDAWPDVIGFFERRRDLARHAIGKFTYRERLPGSHGAPLSADRIGQLLDLMFTAFPPAEDPRRDGASFMSERDAAIDYRDRLLNWLSNQTDEAAVKSLRLMEQKHGAKYPWLRRSRANVERRHLLAQWAPIPLETVASILDSADRRLLRSTQDVVDGIIDALHRYNTRLQDGDLRGVEDLWNTPHGQRASPKEEERVSDKICEAIRETFVGYSVTASREVQIRRRLVPKADDGEPGSKVDVFVERPSMGGSSNERLVVVVEVKLSCNREAKTGLQKQLVDQYLTQLDADRGVFVVAFFDAPNLAKSHRPIWKTIDAAKAELTSQADAVASETGDVIQVATFVLDARLAAHAGAQQA